MPIQKRRNRLKKTLFVLKFELNYIIGKNKSLNLIEKKQTRTLKVLKRKLTFINQNISNSNLIIEKKSALARNQLP